LLDSSYNTYVGLALIMINLVVAVLFFYFEILILLEEKRGLEEEERGMRERGDVDEEQGKEGSEGSEEGGEEGGGEGGGERGGEGGGERGKERDAEGVVSPAEVPYSINRSDRIGAEDRSRVGMSAYPSHPVFLPPTGQGIMLEL
jgi:hypothetical protein